MTARKLVVPVLATFVLAANCLAAEEFRIPNERAKALVGAWIVVMMGEGGQERVVPADKAMTFLFRADGSGIQRKADREKPIVWGADEQGRFAAQWKQEGGNGDGIMGTWEETEEGVKLAMREYEDGKHPEEDQFVLVLKREKEIPEKPEKGDDK